MKALSVRYRPLPLDSRVDFLSVIVALPFEKCNAAGAFIWINTVILIIRSMNMYTVLQY